MRMRARNDLTPHRAAGLWPAHERREGLAQHAPPVGGNLWGWGLGEGRRRRRCSAGPRRRRCQHSGQRMTRRSPPCRRGRAQQHAHGQSRRYRYPEVASDVLVQRLAHGPLRRIGRFRVRDRGNKTTLLGLFRRTMRSRLARTLGHPARETEKALGPCELRALLCDAPCSRPRTTAEGASQGVVGTLLPTRLATFDGKPNLQPTSHARRDRNRFRSLQGRVTTATPASG